MGVAVGRAVNKKGLRVLNFNPYMACIKHPQVVDDFYNMKSNSVQDDLSCCDKRTYNFQMNTIQAVFHFHGPANAANLNCEVNNVYSRRTRSLQDTFPWDTKVFVQECLVPNNTQISRNEISARSQHNKTLL